jgi:hypothetical protein
MASGERQGRTGSLCPLLGIGPTGFMGVKDEHFNTQKTIRPSQISFEGLTNTQFRAIY